MIRGNKERLGQIMNINIKKVIWGVTPNEAPFL
jgi:hypothetical protein